MATKIISSQEEKAKLFAGIDKCAKVIGSTLGAKGTTVLISQGQTTEPVITKDGVTVSRNLINLEDKIENVGSMLVYNAARKTVNDAGDGTTTTSVLLNAIVTEGNKVISAGTKPQDVKAGIDLAVETVVAELKRTSEDIGEDNDKILNIATISANNDTKLGLLIADAYKQIGKRGVLTLEKSATEETYTKVVDGYEFNRGYISAGYVNNQKMQCVLENPCILVADYTLTRFADISAIGEEMVKTGRPIVIIATDVEGEAYGTLLHNKMKGGLKICVIKAPNPYKKEGLADIAVLTGATVICDEAGLKLKSAKMSHIGSCEKIIVTDRTTTIIKGGGDASAILLRKAEITTMIEQAIAPEQKEAREKRLAQVSGSIGVMYVGATTEVERDEKYDRVDDALRAVKSAIEEGVSCGGGISLLRCVDVLNEIKGFNDGITAGINIVKKAIEAPLRQMLKNAGADDSIFGEVKTAKGSMGYNVKTNQMEDLRVSGVIDSTKVCRVSLENAASVAGAILSTEYLLVEMGEINKI